MFLLCVSEILRLRIFFQYLLREGEERKLEAYVDVLPWLQIIWVLGIAKGGGHVHGRRNGLVVVDVVVGVNRKRSHRQLLVRESRGELFGAVKDGVSGWGRHNDGVGYLLN